MKRRQLLSRVSAFWDTTGFALLTTLCVTVITATAIWTNQNDAPFESPPYPTAEGYHAASLLQQSLPEAATPTPLPTSQPPLWSAPLPTLRSLQGFTTDMVRSDWSGLWAVHEGTDLAAEAGTPVMAAANGKVSDVGEDPLLGTWIELSHADGYHSRYACLAVGGGLKIGDPVRAGQTIGFVGNTGRSESHLEPHLHFEIFRNDRAIDPLTLFE